MCVFCKDETVTEETKKKFIKYCGNCKSKIVISKKDNSIIVPKFPQRDKIRTLMFYVPFFLAGLYLLFDGGTTEYHMRILLVGFILFVALLIFCSIMNFRNYEKYGYIYLGINRLIKNDDKKLFLRLSKITNYSIIILGIYVIIRMSLMLLLI
jgi:hypothetical protein